MILIIMEEKNKEGMSLKQIQEIGIGVGKPIEIEFLDENKILGYYSGVAPSETWKDDYLLSYNNYQRHDSGLDGFFNPIKRTLISKIKNIRVLKF